MSTAFEAAPFRRLMRKVINLTILGAETRLHGMKFLTIPLWILWLGIVRSGYLPSWLVVLVSIVVVGLSIILFRHERNTEQELQDARGSLPDVVDIAMVKRREGENSASQKAAKGNDKAGGALDELDTS